jgi:signal transduction histidine kinase
MKILTQGAIAAESWGGEASLAGRDLRVLEEELTRLEHLTQSFLDFARPPRLEPRTLDVRKLVEEALGVMGARLAHSKIRLKFVPPREPVLGVVDPGQFRQVLLNLLLNAADALAGDGMIEVSLEGDATTGFTLRVSDTGPGLPASLAGRLFAPFATTKETGMGLGLSICKRIVEGHGGTITAGNGPERGAVFTVRLPLARSETPVPAAGA